MPDKSEIDAGYQRIANEPDIIRRMALISFTMDCLKDPVDAMTTYNTDETQRMTYEAQQFKNLVMRVAAETGADPKQIADPETRTPEQMQAMAEACARDQLARINAFINSNYYAALTNIISYCEAMEMVGTKNIYNTISENAGGAKNGNVVNVPYSANLFYFAINTSIMPHRADSLTAENKAEVIQYFSDMDAFYRANMGTINSEQELLKRYISAKYPSLFFASISDIAIIPKYYYIPNTKVSNTLTTANADKRYELEVSKKGAKKKVYTMFMLSYRGSNVTLKGQNPLAEFDRNVFNAIISLCVAGNTTFTPQQVWRAMEGKTEQEKPTQLQVRDVIDSIEKMRFMEVSIDFTQHLEMNRIDPHTLTIGRSSYMLPVEPTYVRGATSTVMAYELISEPMLYTYSKAVKQIYCAPIEILDIKKIDKNGKLSSRSAETTRRRSVIKNHLLWRIEGMKNDKNNVSNNCIRYADYFKDGVMHKGVYGIAGHPELSKPPTDGEDLKKRRNCARDIREDVNLILSNWVQRGYIDSFQEYKDKADKGAISGVKIKIPKNCAMENQEND